MARLRLSAPARADVVDILAASLERWGVDGQHRYGALLAEAMRAIAADPRGAGTVDRASLRPGVRSFHVRHVRRGHGVGSPVHVVYYRATDTDVIEIVRVLHERMEPSRHIGGPARRSPRGRRR